MVVQTSNGPEIGQVVEPPRTVDDSELPRSLKKVTRVATGKDLEAQAAGEGLRKQAMATCREMIASHGLDMKLVGADIGFGGEKITFSFYSDERVDFRALVADLAKALKMRIELRQVGAREEARMVGRTGSVRPGSVLHPVPGRRRAGVHPHGQGAEPAPQSHEDLRPVRPAHVLSQVRAGAVRALPQGGAAQGHPGARPRLARA